MTATARRLYATERAALAFHQIRTAYEEGRMPHSVYRAASAMAAHPDPDQAWTFFIELDEVPAGEGVIFRLTDSGLVCDCGEGIWCPMHDRTVSTETEARAVGVIV